MSFSLGAAITEFMLEVTKKAIDEMKMHFNGFSKFEYDKGTIVPYKGGYPTHTPVWDKITTSSDQTEQGA